MLATTSIKSHGTLGFLSDINCPLLDAHMIYTSYSELCYLQLFGDSPHQVAGVVVDDVLDLMDEIGRL